MNPTNEELPLFHTKHIHHPIHINEELILDDLNSVVDHAGFEPATSAMRMQRSSQLS